MEGVALAAFTADEERARGLLQELLADFDPAEGKLVLDHRSVVAVGLAEPLESGCLVLGLGERGATPGLYLQAHALGLGLFFFQHPGDVAMPKEDNFVGEKDLEFVEGVFEEWRGRTKLPNEFVVPGESRLGALLDVSRSVVRRAERSLVTAGYADGHPYAVRTVNRLSDLLYILARNADGENLLSKGS